jgi:hypothetical protein
MGMVNFVILAFTVALIIASLAFPWTLLRKLFGKADDIPWQEVGVAAAMSAAIWLGIWIFYCWWGIMGDWCS